MTAGPLCGIGCGEERTFHEPIGGSAGDSATTAKGGDEAEGGSGNAQGATPSGGSAGSDATGGSAGTGASANEGGSAGEGSEPTDWACVTGDVEQTASGTTADAGNDFSASCGTGTSPDVAYRFVAPSAGYYSFDTVGSGFDTVLSLHSSCEGRELACNQDHGGLPQSEVVANLAKDEEVLVVVDGNVGDQGQYALKVEPVTCPGLDITGQPFPVNLSTVGQQDNVTPTCGDDSPSPNSPERTLRWIPDEDGLYRFSLTSSAFSPTLSIHEGAKCGGTLLQCSYNVSGGHPAQVTRRLKAGEPITIVVDATDGTAGAFTLDMVKLPDACPALPKLTASKTGVALNGTTGTRLLSSSCTWAGNQPSGTNQHYPEHIYPITIPATGVSGCNYSFDNMSSGWVAYLIRGSDCGGEELECIPERATGAGFTFSNDEAGDYLLVIENSFAFGGTLTYDINVTCY